MIGHLLRFHVDIVPRVGPLLLDEIVLLLQADRFGLSDLLLAELSLIIVLLSHTVQIVLNLVFLPADFLDGCQLLVPKVFVAEEHLLFLLLLSLSHGFLLGLEASLALLLFALLK